MAFWAAAGVVYFIYIAVVATLLPRLTAGQRVRAVAVAAVGVLTSVWGGSAEAFWARSLVLPPLVLLLSYWAVGLLWTGPMPRIERWLADWDVRLGVPAAVARMPRAIILILESAYAGV